MSFINERVQPEGLTFDDVLLVPAYSEVLPREVDIRTRFSRNIRLNIPIVSAAMDTVTEAPLAIALAREGGIGVIHKNMSIAEQAAHVRRVKRAENGMIYDPVTISKENTVGDALNLMKENRIGGIPVVDGARKLIGIVTNRDLRFQRDMSRRIEEVMTPGDRLVTTHNPELAHAQEILLNSKIEKLPVVDDAGRLVGLITYKDITKVQDHPNACTWPQASASRPMRWNASRRSWPRTWTPWCSTRRTAIRPTSFRCSSGSRRFIRRSTWWWATSPRAGPRAT